jgi:membrane protease YdiL (CAAX protease family)
MIGIAIGLIIFSSGYLVLIHFNEIVFVKINLNVNEILISVLHFTIVAGVEETLFRGYVLKNFMESFNKYAALIISSGLFSSMHYFNPDFDLFSFFSLFLAGILFGISYIYTKNLWFPIALHLSWNLFQALFGFNVSGRDTFSIIEFKILESNLINGGSFGFEGSVLSIIAQAIIITIIITYYRRKKISWLIK